MHFDSHLQDWLHVATHIYIYMYSMHGSIRACTYRSGIVSAAMLLKNNGQNHFAARLGGLQGKSSLRTSNACCCFTDVLSHSFACFYVLSSVLSVGLELTLGTVLSVGPKLLEKMF